MHDSDPTPGSPADLRVRDLPKLLQSLPRLSDDEAAAFAEDIGQARAEMNAISGEQSGSAAS